MRNLWNGDGNKIKRNLADWRFCGGTSPLTQTTGLNIKNLSDIETLVNTRLDESEVSLLTPPPTTAPEGESKDGKENRSKEYTHDDPRDSTLRNLGPRDWSMKGAIGNPEK